MDFPWRAVVQSLMGAFVAVEFEILFQPFVTIGSGFVALQVNVFVLQRSPQTFDEHVVQSATFAIHADLDVV